MFSKKAKVLIGTAVFTLLGVAVTGVASARVGRVAEVRHSVSAALRPTIDEATSNDDAEPHAHDGPQRRRPPHLEAAATALGMTPDALKSELMNGTSLASLATAKNVAVQKVIDAIVADEKVEIAEAVTAGKLTQARADELNAKVTEHVTAIVNGERPAPLFGRDDHDGHDGRDGHGDHGGRGRHGMGDDHRGADDTDDA